jgi:hypothetical protein
MAELFTDKLKLSKRDTGDLNWGAGHNANLDTLDAHAQQGTLRPPRSVLATLGVGAVGANLLANTIYYYKVTAINAAGETTGSTIPAVLEAQVSEGATPLPVNLQWEITKGATGYRIYKSASSGQEKFLVEVSGESTLSYIDAGNIAVNNSISVPSLNTARTSVRKIIAGTGINVSPADGTGDVIVSAPGSGVIGIRKLGDPSALTGDVKLEAGSNITIVQDAPNNKFTISAAGGGSSGYFSAVVAAPTGVAATDTANIQAALNAVGSLGGGIAMLREGTYVINATLNIPSRVTFAGQGMNGSTVRADNAMGFIGMITGNSYSGLRDMTIDENYGGRPAGNSNTMVDMIGGNVTPVLVENVTFTNNYAFNYIVKMSDKGVMRNCRIYNNGNFLTAMIYHGEQIEGCYLERTQLNQLQNIIEQARRIVNNQYVTNVGGNFPGAGIVTLNQGIITGNFFQLGGGLTFINCSTSRMVIVGNSATGATILLNSGVQNTAIVGNTGVAVTNNSGNGTNQIANNGA